MVGIITKPGLFRLLLALAVVASHLTGAEVGRLAVLMFFYLSGYWVTRLWDTRFAPNRLVLFYGSRWFRIWPLYIICTVVAVLVAGQALRPVDFTLLGVATADNDPLAVAWSLDVELQFYLLLPAVAWLLSREWKVITPLIVGCIAIVGWVAFWKFGYVTVAQYLPAFALGCQTFIGRWTPSRRVAHLSLVAFLGFTVAFGLVPYTATFLSKVSPDPFHRDIFSFIWMLPLLPYIAHSLRLRSEKLDRRLGDLSYPLYLVHYPIIAAITDQLGDGLGAKGLGIGGSVLVAIALYLLVDRKIDAMRQRYFELRPERATLTQQI